jgi:hypothetical protein
MMTLGGGFCGLFCGFDSSILQGFYVGLVQNMRFRCGNLVTTRWDTPHFWRAGIPATGTPYPSPSGRRPNFPKRIQQMNDGERDKMTQNDRISR